MRGDSAKKNFVYQFLYQIIILVIPLIVSPYLTRTMSSETLGIYTYTYSIAYYFVVLAMLGISRHGQRTIANKRNDFLALRRSFWSLFYVHLICSLFALLLYVIYVCFICNDNKTIAFVQTIYVLSALFDITWLFQGLEKFKNVVIRNAIVKILECVCIFAFVKSPQDLVIYTFIMSASICLGQIILLPQAIKAIPPVKVSFSEMREHIKPMLVLFVAAVAATLYTIFDKTLLGILASHESVAYYEYSNKIINIPKTFITVISTVLFPRACLMVTEHNRGGLEKILKESLLVTYFIGFASFFGLLGIGDLLAKVYYGDGFSACGEIIISMAILILIIGVGEVVRSQYIYPLKRDKAMVRILLLNAAINLILSCALIPVLDVYGAVIGTVVAEIIGLTLEVYLCKDYISVRSLVKPGIPFAIIGLFMFIVIRIINMFVDQSLSGFLIMFVVAAVFYCVVSFIYCYFIDKDTKRILSDVIHKLKVSIKR